MGRRIDNARVSHQIGDDPPSRVLTYLEGSVVRFGSDNGAHQFPSRAPADVNRDQVVAADTLHNLDAHAVVAAELRTVVRL